MPGHRRVVSLDLLRALAILLVLGAHAPDVPARAWGHSFYLLWHRCGWAGVDVFFALSGFLIFGLLLAERRDRGTISVCAFAARRFFKIYPPYVLFLVVLVSWLYAHTPGPAGSRLAAIGAEFWPALVHLQNYVPIRSASHLWSIAMEEHCYLLLLLLALLSGRRSPPSRAIPLTLIALLVASWAGRWAYVAWSYRGGPIGFAFTHNRLDAVVAGALVAWIAEVEWHWLPAVRRRQALLLGVGALCCLSPLLWEIYDHRVFFFLAGIPLQGGGLFCFLLVVAARTWNQPGQAPLASRSWPVRLLAFIGISSYSTYLWHLPFAEGIATVLRRRIKLEQQPAAPLLWMLVSVALSIAIGALLYLMVERPALRWRQRWLREKRASREWR